MQGKHVKSQRDDVLRWLFDLMIRTSALVGASFFVMVIVNIWRWVAW